MMVRRNKKHGTYIWRHDQEYYERILIVGYRKLEKYIDFKKTRGEYASACLKEQKEETHEPPSSEIGEVEELLHE